MEKKRTKYISLLPAGCLRRARRPTKRGVAKGFHEFYKFVRNFGRLRTTTVQQHAVWNQRIMLSSPGFCFRSATTWTNPEGFFHVLLRMSHLQIDCWGMRKPTTWVVFWPRPNKRHMAMETFITDPVVCPKANHGVGDMGLCGYTYILI